MDHEKLTALYEKLYFAEAEARDRIVARLQLPLTLLIAIVGGLVYLLQNYDVGTGMWTVARLVFWFFMAAAVISIGLGFDRFVHALHNNEYHFLPSAQEIARYNETVLATYEAYPDRDILVSKAMDTFIVGRMIENASFNTTTNDRRSLFLHQCTEAIIGAVILLVAAYGVFWFGDLERGKAPRSEIQLKQPINVKIVQ